MTSPLGLEHRLRLSHRLGLSARLGGAGPPSWVPNPGNAPDFAINWQTNQVWQKGIAGFVTPAAFGVATVRASVKWVVDSGGNWTSIANNVTAFSNLGRICEEARTNLFLNSQVPVTQTITVVNTSTYTISLVGTGSLVLTGAITGTVTQGNPVTAAASSTSLTVTPATVAGTFINAQVELGTWATSPIVTAGASATRAADVTTLTIAPGSAYSYFSECTPQAPVAFATNQVALSIDDSSTANRAYMFRTGSSSQAASGMISGGVQGWAATASAPTWAVGAVGVLAASFVSGTQIAAFNGVVETTSLGPSATMPVSPTKLHLGCRGDSTQQFNGLMFIDAVWLTQAVPSGQLTSMT